MKRWTIAFLFCFAVLASFGQNNFHSGKGFDYEAALDSFLRIIVKSLPGKEDTTTLDACFQIADIYRVRALEPGDSIYTTYLDSSQKYIIRTIDLSRQLDRPDYEAAAYTIWGEVLTSSHSDEKTIVEKYLTALTLYKTWMRSHKTSSAVITDNQSLIYANIGVTYFANKEYDNALRYCDSAVMHAEPAYTAGYPLVYKARIYMAQNRLDSAETALRNALFVMSVQPMTMRWEAMDYLAGIFIGKGNPDSAISILREALAGDRRGFHLNYHYYWLGKAFIDLGKPDSALKYARLELALNNRRGGHSNRLPAYELFYKIDSLTGNQAGELSNYRQWVRLKDSLSENQHLKDVAEVQHKYDYQAVQQQSERQQFEQQQRLQQQTRVSLIVFLCLLVVAAAALAFYNRKMRHKNVELGRKNQEILDAHFKGQHFERKRVATELHDNLSSLLAATKLSIEVLDPSTLPPGEQKLFQSVLDMMDTACNEVRYIAHNMMPVNLENQGLHAALESLVAKLNQAGVIIFELTNIDQNLTLDKVTAFNIYSICLECCNNILRHSAATRAAVVFKETAQELHLLISDNGKGIPDIRADGMGIRNVNERIESLRGSLEIESSTGGTSFWFTIPLTSQEVANR